MGKRILSGYVNGNDILDKFNEEDIAAMIILHIKHANLDEKFAIALHEIKNQSESSIMCINTLERLDPQFTN